MTVAKLEQQNSPSPYNKFLFVFFNERDEWEKNTQQNLEWYCLSPWLRLHEFRCQSSQQVNNMSEQIQLGHSEGCKPRLQALNIYTCEEERV